MAKNFNVKGFSIVSPKGEALWCKAYEPDTKYNPGGDLTTSLILDPELDSTKNFISKIEDLRDRALGELKANLGAKGNQWSGEPVYTDDYDRDGNPTGNIVVKFKLKDVEAKKAQGKQHSIVVKDNNLKDISKEPIMIGNGSIIRCGAFAFAYEMAATKKVGVSLQWQKLQVIELAEYGGGDDFEVEEGNASDLVSEVEDDLDF